MSLTLENWSIKTKKMPKKSREKIKPRGRTLHTTSCRSITNRDWKMKSKRSKDRRITIPKPRKRLISTLCKN
jgi:hypothetical protein